MYVCLNCGNTGQFWAYWLAERRVAVDNKGRLVKDSGEHSEWIDKPRPSACAVCGSPYLASVEDEAMASKLLELTRGCGVRGDSHYVCLKCGNRHRFVGYYWQQFAAEVSYDGEMGSYECGEDIETVDSSPWSVEMCMECDSENIARLPPYLIDSLVAALKV